jgi:hypothetical protein
MAPASLVVPARHHRADPFALASSLALIARLSREVSPAAGCI